MAILNSGLAKSSAVDAYTIDNSLRFNDGDSAYLTKTDYGAGNRTSWTWSGWTKFSQTTTQPALFSWQVDGSPNHRTALDTGNSDLNFANYTGSYAARIVTNAKYRDPSAWYHVVAVWDTGNGTSGDRLRLYVNGERVTSADLGTEVYPTEDFNSVLGDASGHFDIGQQGDGSQYMDGYLAEVYFIDGQSLDADSFGELDSATNQWKPIDASGLTFGTNGFYQKYGGTELANSFTDSAEGGFFPTEAITADVLIVAGGGGGGGGYGNGAGGGGGAGGFRALASQSLTANGYGIVVGAGGTGGATFNSGAGLTYQGDKGGNSSFGTTSATGGGGGGGFNMVGLTGGSAGGSTNGDVAIAGNEGGYDPVEGFGAAASTSGGNSGSGGGGASEEGATNTGSPAKVGGVGGDGTANSWRTDAAVTYAGGGGSGRGEDGISISAGGAGGGGAGGNGAASSASNGADGTDGLGGGGGGAGHTGAAGTGGVGGAGGNGIVVIRYQSTTVKATGGTITTYGSGASQYQVHTFTTSVTTPPHTITANGDVTNTRAVRKVGDSSIKFDGTGDYLSVPDSSDWPSGTGSWTLEWWVNFDNSNDEVRFIGQYVDTNNYWKIEKRAHDDSAGELQLRWVSGGSNVVFEDSAALSWSSGTWYHMAVVKDGNDYEVFRDGVSVQSFTDTDSLADYSASLIIGQQGSSHYLDGYMDEIRISDTARYTAAFTPSTTAFTADANTKLLIHSNWDGGLGADSSGNYNTFTPTNLVATDQMIDTPTNSFATINPLDGNGVLSEGNLKVVTPA